MPGQEAVRVVSGSRFGSRQQGIALGNINSQESFFHEIDNERARCLCLKFGKIVAEE